MTAPREFAVPVRPGHRETLTSYTTRVLEANHETALHLKHQLRQVPPAQGGSTDDALHDLLQARTRRTLHLSSKPTGYGAHADGSTCFACTDALTARWACTHCARGAQIAQRPHFGPLVCLHHHRWVGLASTPDAQTTVGDEHLAAQRRLTRLIRAHKVDARLYRHVDQAVRRTGENEQDAFPAIVAILDAITSTGLLRSLFAPDALFADSYALLAETIAAVTGQTIPAVARAVWSYLRPSFWALRHAVITSSPYQPAWNHDFAVPAAIAAAYIAQHDDLEPFENFLAASDDNIDAAFRSSGDNARSLPPQPGDTIRRRLLTICERGHQFETRLSNNIERNPSSAPHCPACSHKLVQPGYNDLQTTHPHIAAEFAEDLNDGITACQIAPASHTTYTWRCPNGHTYPATPSNRTQTGGNCGICSGRTIAPGINDISTTHPDIAKEIDPDWAAENNVGTLSAGSNTHVRWRCENGHQYAMRAWDRTHGGHCAQCVREHNQALKLDLSHTHPDIAREWHPTLNLGKKPEDYTHGSGEKMWWLCPRGHDYYMRIERRTAGYHCIYCSGRSLQTGINDLQTTDPELATEFHTYLNGFKAPDNFIAGTDLYWWKCSAHGHKYRQSVPHRRKSGGCPDCPPEDRILNSTAATLLEPEQESKETKEI